MFNCIDDWVDYIQSLYAREIDLSLDRVAEVYLRLRPQGVNFKIITIAGTNGKGSTCEILAAIYHSAGYATGKYTSPHIELFNERFAINRQIATDQELLDVFARVELARESTRLTFFEFGTLVAIELFADNNIDVAIMEVGLGGRLDAVNILDADIAVVTSISIDHTDWLGDTIDEIAGEKIAITRPNKPCVVGIIEPPSIVIEHCQKHKVPISLPKIDFDYAVNQTKRKWNWSNQDKTYENLSFPFNQEGIQLENAAVALQTVSLLQGSLPVIDKAIYRGLSDAALIARCQLISSSPIVVVDVAHNLASIKRLTEFIQGFTVQGKIYALCGMLKDKQIEKCLGYMVNSIDEWKFVSIDHPRGSQSSELLSRLHSQAAIEIAANRLNDSKLQDILSSNCFDDVISAYNHISKKLNNDDALIVFGSFFIVSDIMQIVSFDSEFIARQNNSI